MSRQATKLLKKGEAADRLRRSERSVDRLIASGILPVVRIGGRILVREEDIELLIRQSIVFGDKEA